MNRTIVLLRGINVSGKNKVPMAELRAVLANEQFDGVSTYIQSGNIALDTDLEKAELLDTVEALVSTHFDVHVPAVSVRQDDISDLLRAAPFPEDADPAISLIYFPRAEIDVARVKALDPAKHPHDTITATPNALYVAYGQGQSKSKLTVDQLEKAAGTTLTGRNLRSTKKLQTL